MTYGRFATALTNAADMYVQKFKGISISMVILTRALVGYYVNFGVFELYGDPALKVEHPIVKHEQSVLAVSQS